MQKFLLSYYHQIVSYLATIKHRQIWSIALFVFAVDQGASSFLLFFLFAVVFFGFFSKIEQGALLSCTLYIVYFLRRLFGGDDAGSALLSMIAYYSMLFSVFLLLIKPGFIQDIKTNIQESSLWNRYQNIIKIYHREKIYQTIYFGGIVVLVCLFASWFVIDIYKSFLGRSIVWSIVSSLVLVSIFLRFLLSHNLVCKK